MAKGVQVFGTSWIISTFRIRAYSAAKAGWEGFQAPPFKDLSSSTHRPLTLTLAPKSPAQQRQDGALHGDDNLRVRDQRLGWRAGAEGSGRADGEFRISVHLGRTGLRALCPSFLGSALGLGQVGCRIPYLLF